MKEKEKEKKTAIVFSSTDRSNKTVTLEAYTFLRRTSAGVVQGGELWLRRKDKLQLNSSSSKKKKDHLSSVSCSGEIGVCVRVATTARRGVAQ